MEHQEFWANYQPGFRFATAPPGTREFFQQVDEYRYTLEPHIPGVVRFERWAGCDVLEAGCGIGTDGARFAAAGARYTGLDFSPTARHLAKRRFELSGLDGRFVGGSVMALPFKAGSFDLVYSHGVIHHVVDTDEALREFARVLRPGGTALVMVYHRHSLNYHVSIMMIRRALVFSLMAPKSTRLISKVTGEPEEVISGHRDLLARYGTGYVTDRDLFLSHNTDGPRNDLAKVYSRRAFEEMAAAAGLVPAQTHVRYLNTRLYPGGTRFAATAAGRWLGDRIGWHLYLTAYKPTARRPPQPARSTASITSATESSDDRPGGRENVQAGRVANSK